MTNSAVYSSFLVLLLEEQQVHQLSQAIEIGIPVSRLNFILTSKRNASPKRLHNLLHVHHTSAKALYVLILVVFHILIYLKFGSVFNVFQNFDRAVIYKDAPCARGTSVFAMKVRRNICHESCFTNKKSLQL